MNDVSLPKEWVETTNPSRPHGFDLLTPETMVPYQKNPILSAFFREIDRADELGSDMRKMMLYGKKYRLTEKGRALVSPPND